VRLSLEKFLKLSRLDSLANGSNDVEGLVRTSLVNFAIRKLVRPKLAACRTPLDVRKAFASGMPWPRNIRFDATTVGGVAGEWAEPPDPASALGTLLYIHGGGFVAMSARTHRCIAGGFAQRGIRVFTPDYRLVPENRFPAPLHDVMKVWSALRAEIDGPIFLAGDSAGGGLAAALLLNLRDLGKMGPAATCLFSPWADLELTGASLQFNKDRDPMQVESTLRMLAVAYAGSADLRSPLISPVNGAFTGIGPILAFAGDTEILLDDARRLVERAQVHGVSANLRVYPNMPHSWPLLHKILPEGREALDEACSFFQSSALRSIGNGGPLLPARFSISDVAMSA
jgi:epsilon-lactone hydrolase